MTATPGQAQDRSAARRERLAAALRSNLRRRSAQKKERMAYDPKTEESLASASRENSIEGGKSREPA
jgi:hypothetical protein